MDEQPVHSDRDQFDEVAYLRLYPDIATAIAEGREPGAWEHYDRHGRKEGRKTNDFDADFYLRSYPAVQHEVAAGLAVTPFAHYLKFERARGFLSNARAPRPADAVATPSRYGGLWPDLPNAADLIEGKLAIGQITERQAEKLTFWRNNCYVILGVLFLRRSRTRRRRISTAPMQAVSRACNSNATASRQVTSNGGRSSTRIPPRRSTSIISRRRSAT